MAACRCCAVRTRSAGSTTAAGQQAGANLERVTAASKQLELVHVELEPGDALFFHCNLLHCSAPNNSEQPRWSFIACYNAMSNIPYEGGHGEPVPVEIWPDDSILRIGQQQLAALESALAAASKTG